MVKFKELVINFAIVSIIVFALFQFILISQTENEAEDPLTNQQKFNSSINSLGINIESSTKSASEKYDVFNSEDPKPGFGSIVLFGIVSAGKTFSSIVFGTFGAIIKLPLAVLGIPEAVAKLITTILIITLIIGVWLLYKMGG